MGKYSTKYTTDKHICPKNRGGGGGGGGGGRESPKITRRAPKGRRRAITT